MKNPVKAIDKMGDGWATAAVTAAAAAGIKRFQRAFPVRNRKDRGKRLVTVRTGTGKMI